MTARELDLVLFGATGFVGRLVAAYLARAAPTDLRVALAGRDRARLEHLRESLPSAAAGWECLQVDARDGATLRALATRTRVVVTTVGPYAEHGMPLLLACAETGTDYADLTGEPLFVRDSIDAAHGRAVETGARIVHSCGFDSVPSDLNVYLTHRRAQADGAGSLVDSTSVATLRGGLSGGTIASGRGQWAAIAQDPSLQSVVDDPYALARDRRGERFVGPQSDVALGRGSRIDPSLPGWVGTFLMAPHNTRIVRRSSSLLGEGYGPSFRYREVMSAGRSRWSVAAAASMTAGLWLMTRLGPVLHRGPGPRILDRLLPARGAGPSPEAQDAGFYSMDTFTTTSGGSRYHATFAQSGDPGYKATALLLGEVGLCLALDRDRLTPDGGVLTPAVALAEPLVERLVAEGVTVTVEETTSRPRDARG